MLVHHDIKVSAAVAHLILLLLLPNSLIVYWDSFLHSILLSIDQIWIIITSRQSCKANIIISIQHITYTSSFRHWFNINYHFLVNVLSNWLWTYSITFLETTSSSPAKVNSTFDLPNSFNARFNNFLACALS